MADEIKVAEELYSSIPDDADEQTKLYMRAQVVIQGAFYSLGDRAVLPGEATLGYDEIENILCMALAMMIAGDRGMKTRRDVRERVDHHAKYIRGAADILREAGDRQALDILETLHLRRSSSH